MLGPVVGFPEDIFRYIGSLWRHAWGFMGSRVEGWNGPSPSRPFCFVSYRHVGQEGARVGRCVQRVQYLSVGPLLGSNRFASQGTTESFQQQTGISQLFCWSREARSGTIRYLGLDF